jgi:hypothetical protein
MLESLVIQGHFGFGMARVLSLEPFCQVVGVQRQDSKADAKKRLFLVELPEQLEDFQNFAIPRQHSTKHARYTLTVFLVLFYHTQLGRPNNSRS